MMIIISPYIPHHDVDKGVLYEGEEDEEGARGHEHVNRLVGNKIIINNKTSLWGIKKHLNILSQTLGGWKVGIVFLNWKGR